MYCNQHKNHSNECLREIKISPIQNQPFGRSTPENVGVGFFFSLFFFKYYIIVAGARGRLVREIVERERLRERGERERDLGAGNAPLFVSDLIWGRGTYAPPGVIIIWGYAFKSSHK